MSPIREICCLVLLLCSMANGLEEENVDRTEVFNAGILGWKDSNSTGYQYVVPLYSHHYDLEKDWDLTLIYPLLSARYRGEIGNGFHTTAVGALPLLAAMGSARWGRRNFSGYFSPYLAAGSFSWQHDGFSAESAGAMVMPWIPFFNDFFALHLYTSSEAGGLTGCYTCYDLLALPGIGAGLITSRTAGIEEDYRLLSLWDMSLYRSSLNLSGEGFSPSLYEFSTRHLARAAVRRTGESGEVHLERRAAALGYRLNEARSGNPVDHLGIVDPMLVLEHHGDGLKAVGVEPVFYYDEDEGFTIPLLLSTVGGKEGFSFGSPAVKHLFPLVHGNASGTRYDFVFNYGTFFNLEDYSALDLKLLFNYQHSKGRGALWGFLPYLFGKLPMEALNENVQFIQMPGFMVSYWDLERHSGFELLPPFLFSYTRSKGEKTKVRLLLLFGLESSAEETVFDLLWMPVFSFGKG